MSEKRITLPLTDETIDTLRAGDKVYLTGEILVARDAAHKRLFEGLEKKEKLPVELSGAVIYYMGPSPARPGKVIGSAGPTTSKRMDKYTPALLSLGLKGMIGKGRRSSDAISAIVESHAVYLAAIGGCGALLSKHITSSEVLCYEDLGTEAVRKITVTDFPCFVAVDCRGDDIYNQHDAHELCSEH